MAAIAAISSALSHYFDQAYDMSELDFDYVVSQLATRLV